MLGDIFSVSARDADEYLVAAIVAVEAFTATVVPLIDEVHRATEWDLLLDGEALGYPAAAQIWNHGTVLHEQLVDRLADAGGAREWLLECYQALLESLPLPDDAPTGIAVTSEDDPRLAWQSEDAARLHDWWRPAMTLAGASDVADLVRLRREELDLDESLRGAVDAATLKGLESGELDLLEQVSGETLAEVLRRLQVQASGLLRRLIETTVRGPGVEPSGLAFNRRRRGSGAPRRASVEDRAREYAQDVIRRLEEDPHVGDDLPRVR